MQFKRMKGIYSAWAVQNLALCIIPIVFCFIQAAVRTSNKEVELGGNVTLRCTLIQHPEIHQVTWKKKKNGYIETIATYNRNGSQRILKYKDRINFTILRIEDSAINLSNVSTEDNGCYQCEFFVFPEGPLVGQPCISVYDDIKTSIHYKFTDNRLSASCLATGFPRPNISWFPPGGEKKEKEITNPNGTLSVISNILVNISNAEQQLTCHVSHRGEEIKIKVPAKDQGNTKKSFPMVAIILTLILVILFIVAGVCFWRQHRKKHRGF